MTCSIPDERNNQNLIKKQHAMANRDRDFDKSHSLIIYQIY